MPNKLHINKILNAWLDYFYLDNLSRAEVNAADDSNLIIDKGISLIGDNLLIEESLFKQFKQQFIALDKKGKSNDFQIAVSFPQIWRAIEGSRRFYPLFQIDLSSIFTGSYRARGWDLNEFEFQPIIPNLIEFCELDEEEIENLITREGLKVFLTTTFNKSFNTLQDFIDLIDVPDRPYTTKRNPYLFQCSFGGWNYNLHNDLHKILSQQHPVWAQPGHPAYEYLFGTKYEPNHEMLFLGAFPTAYPPTVSQAVALKHQKENSLTAVIGPPGNGKTFAVLQTISQQVVKRAVQLAQTGEDASNLTLVTSTNNRAVINVEERLAQHFQSDRFYLLGGSKELIAKLVLPKLQAATDWLQRHKFNATELEEISTQLLTGVNQLYTLKDQDQLHQQQQVTDSRLLQQLDADIQVLNEEIATSQNLQQQGETDYEEFPLEAYQLIQQHLENAVRCRSRVKSSKYNRNTDNLWIQLLRWLTQFWQQLTKTSSRHILKRLHKQIESPTLATLATPFPFQIPLTRESLVDAVSTVAAQLETAKQWHVRFQYLTNAQSRLFEMTARKQRVEARIASHPTEDFYSRFYTEHHQLQVRLFELSWQYLELKALQRKDEIIADLKTYIAFLNGEYEPRRNLARDWRNIYRNISLVFPVFTSTLHSIRNLFPYTDSGCIDQLIVDEAGMIPPHQAFPALVRCNKALVVGDPWQLEPVVNLPHQTLEQYCNQAFIARGLTFVDYDRYSPTATSTATAYHRAAGANGTAGDLGNGILLKEHYRCVEPIISFCDRLCNYGLIVKTQDKSSLLGSNLIAYHVEGKYESHTNPDEIAAVEAIVGELITHGYCINSSDNNNTIGVISPYRRQANALKSHLQATCSYFPDSSIGTVHTFQGGEKSAIILSTRQCRTLDSLWFLNRRPNLLNVAVSRAKELFILVGNLEHLEQAGGYTKMLVEHIRQYGEVRSLS
ncbi:AAA domain-containing protein [Tolypothrix sp. VBCCA 56010]|uniref:DEAD/DEAH box helicase n=1 Tax=Tolypothrix sp. VBCCA 56010 TaxID=3137731 RepID=UPI003D7EA759